MNNIVVATASHLAKLFTVSIPRDRRPATVTFDYLHGTGDLGLDIWEIKRKTTF